MSTFKEFLVWYNNLDVMPFLEAVEKMSPFLKERLTCLRMVYRCLVSPSSTYSRSCIAAEVRRTLDTVKIMSPKRNERLFGCVEVVIPVPDH